MERVKLVVHPREEVGSRNVRRLRKEGLVPGVLYGAGKEARPLSVDEKSLREAFGTSSGLHAVVDITFEGQKTAHVAVLKEYQVDHVRSVVTHVDFHEVKLTDPIEADVAVVLEGTPAGVKLGGILEVLTREVTLKALPTEIPDHISFDVSALEVGDVAHVSDLAIPEGVQILDDLDETLCTVQMPRAVVEPGEGEEGEEGELAPAEEGAEPEVIDPHKQEGSESE
jgi:large subunit ribosomal protein L25